MRASPCLYPVLILIFAAMCAGTAGHAALIEQSLERLRQSPPVCPDAFDFVVVADSNTLEPLEQAEVFKQILREVNVLKPGFVFEAGDIILGGAAEGVPPQWDVFEQTIAACEPPYLAIPGNHDISDAATERIWLERMGPAHYTFAYGNSLFIGLNSEEVGALDRISDEQVAWLKEQLAAATATNIFVFLHRPLFANEGDPETAGSVWEAQWANVAETFRGYPVRAVFAGHEHIYRDCGVRDGVHYVICGGASVYGMRGNADEGKFNHYLRVQVRGGQFSWAVIQPGSILPQDAVTSERIDELFRIRNKWLVSEEIYAPLGEPVDRDLRVTISNPHERVLTSFLRWTVPEGWSVMPEQRDYEIPAHSAAQLVFHVQSEAAGAARFPVPVLRTLYTQTQHGPAVEVAHDLRFVPVLSARRASSPVAPDGVLSEWEGAQFAPSAYPAGFTGAALDDLACETAFLWDEDWLYMAVRVRDNEFHQPYAGDIVWKADNVEMFLDGWSWGLSLTAHGPEVFLYHGINVSAETVNTDVKLSVKRDGTGTFYEAAFPESHLAPLKLAPGASFRFNSLMNDLDPSGPETDRHWLQLAPETGSPGNPPPRVKVVLEP
ncbi:MAG: metallophosphoesterase [Candidatus Hydrogenedentes bacterium]|nr:metallophosphoesterase [Candidatus Hydrogenedentota bacterium]